MDTIEKKVEELVEVLKESNEYQNFQDARKQVDLVPGLEEKIRKFCWENYELQSSDEANLYERIEEFEAQYAELRRNPVVEKYLEQELRMCRILQEINARIMDVIELII